MSVDRYCEVYETGDSILPNNHCYNTNEHPIKVSVTLQQCKDYCFDKGDCIYAEWHKESSCYIYISGETETCCDECDSQGSNWISCKG